MTSPSSCASRLELWQVERYHPQVLEAASQYLRWAGPTFGLFGLGVTLYFASQGSGKVLGPVLASTLRLVLVALVGAWLAPRATEAWPYFALVGAAMVIFGLSTAAAIWLTTWGESNTESTAPPRPAA